MGRVRKLCAALAASALGIAAPLGAQDQPASAFEHEFLTAHNEERRDAGVPPLAWSDELAEEAHAWARRLARQGRLQHASRDERGDKGENLWMGTAALYSARTIFSTFVAEKRHFMNGSFPNVSRTGRWRDVGHYTQVIWRETQQLGCAVARNDAHDFVVCRYWPAGNWYGRTPL
ncbi:CAP domain-containing protein [Alteraurantiacibacter aquimixticola]|uniref:SCP-like extracellular n=1 Tax=Alteraurantiacibacter aquimixticola TaxID=2489173 RepID=A0A4T3F1D5_9SPHN|nr:CAP domain-containing protein [Alteraurantiacibacter aquimixticola]TIX50085.1 SCP-like extracellular [Alteraurantiacibacter aquimixticola]